MNQDLQDAADIADGLADVAGADAVTARGLADDAQDAADILDGLADDDEQAAIDAAAVEQTALEAAVKDPTPTIGDALARLLGID